MTGTGSDQTHLLVVCTAERGLCGGFNSQIARLAREHIGALIGQGKDVKILCVGKKGYDILRRQYSDLIIDRVDLREVKRIGFANADDIAKQVIALFDEDGFDICTLFYSEFKSVITQVPTAQQIIPADTGEVDPGGYGKRRGIRIRTGRGGNPGRSDPAQHCRADFRCPAGKRRVRTGCPDVRHGQRNEKCR